ncbi:MAG: hypothetical protein E2O94_02295 [Alphaproteobacteria bacterium]|nr:MAG: hypothetical protein E2O94_02295 [Alphaproteobacteria bacterium]
MAQALANTPLPDEAAAPTAKPSVSVRPPALVRDAAAPRRALPDRRNWMVQYVFQDDAGKTMLSIITVTAPSYEAAKAYAVEHAPGKEFILSLHPDSGEQFLGQVRHKALALSGK